MFLLGQIGQQIGEIGKFTPNCYNITLYNPIFQYKTCK